MANDIKSSAEDHTLIDMEDDYGDIIDIEALEKTMKAKVGSDSLLPAKCCIFRVPHVLRRQKPEAYTPEFVSIGPYHRGSTKQLKFSENIKQLYLNNLLSRLNISLKTLIQGIDNISEFEKRARDSYAESLGQLNPNELIEMMILNMDCMLQYICHDLLVLENQLPWFVLEHLYSLTVGEYKHLPLIKMVKLVLMSSLKEVQGNFASFLKHSNEDNDHRILHILDLVRDALVFNFQDQLGPSRETVKLPPATTLSVAGVKFQKGKDECGIMNVNFKNGVLTIPELTIGELTEPLFRNLIAFEQCCHGRPPQITSYIFLMHNFIDSRKDIHFLCKQGIICNWLSSENASQLFNRLNNDTVIRNFSYGRLCKEVDDYIWSCCGVPSWNTWLEEIMVDYFFGCKITSLLAGFVLLLLTLLQTAYTIHQYYSPHK